jgi:hypothetical protein
MPGTGGDIAKAYQTLGLPPEASADEIKRTWRRVARSTHPDLHPGDAGAARRFGEARAAYELLTDPTRRAGDGASRAGSDGPDDDWLDACAWMAEAHLLHLRRDVLPRYADGHRSGPALAHALAMATNAGLGTAAPDGGGPPRWVRVWSWWTWRRLDLVVDETPTWGEGPLGLMRTRAGWLRIVLRPRVLWAAGVREDDQLRPVVQQYLDAAVAAAAPVLLDLPRVRAEGEVSVGAARAWWVGRLFWPVMWTLLVVFSVCLLGYAVNAQHPGG